MARFDDKLKEALKVGRSGQLARQTPYERYGFSKNPFLPNLILESPELLVVREKLFLDFAYQIGNTIHFFEEDPVSSFRHLLVHGLKDSGKSVLARHFDSQWSQIGFQDYATLYTDLASWNEPGTNQGEFSSSVSTLLTYEYFLDRIRHMQKPLIIFIDSLDYTITGTAAIPRLPAFLSDIESQAPHGVILIGLINSLTLTSLIEPSPQNPNLSFLNSFNPDYFFIPVFSRSEIRKLIVQRLRQAHTPTELFSARSIELIADYSLGIPTIALNIATHCLNELILQDLDKLKAHLTTKILDKYGFTEAYQIVESLSSDEEDEMANLLTPKRREIITAILCHQNRERYFFPNTGMDGLRSSDLADYFTVNLSTMNYHLKPLTNPQPLPILKTKDYMHDARSKIFYADWDNHIANALEIITVYQHLTAKHYNIQSSSIILSQRENQ
ncbi:MAG: hypothetical protein ACTSW1_03475 [Candidatus Hodarchaeales archaeon]